MVRIGMTKMTVPRPYNLLMEIFIVLFAMSYCRKQPSLDVGIDLPPLKSVQIYVM